MPTTPTTSGFSRLKTSRTSEFEKLAKEMASLAKTKRQDDDRFWKVDTDKAGNGFAVIRFLPAPDGEEVPFVRLWTHGFKGPGGWYFENSLTTIGQNDPVSELNARLWEQGERGREIARKQKRKLVYISNIYVVKDPQHPENEGKVFLFRYGKKIFDMLNEKMSPQFEDDKPMNPFDLWEGANFRIKVTNVEGYRNYDKSTFDAPAPLSKDEAVLEKVWKAEYPLQPFVAPDQFKPYHVLKARLDKVLARPEAVEDAPPAAAAAEPKAVVAPKLAEAFGSPADESAGDDDNLKFFESLAEDE